MDPWMDEIIRVSEEWKQDDDYEVRMNKWISEKVRNFDGQKWHFGESEKLVLETVNNALQAVDKKFTVKKNLDQLLACVDYDEKVATFEKGLEVFHETKTRREDWQWVVQKELNKITVSDKLGSTAFLWGNRGPRPEERLPGLPGKEMVI